MLVCHCHGLSDREIRRTVRDGADSCGQVTRQCGAGGGCGGCQPLIHEIVEQEREAASRTLGLDRAAAR